MPTILITGGAGFIGSHIARLALDREYEVKIIDNFFTGRMENISDIKDQIKLIKGDIRNQELLKKEFEGMDFVSHQAALRCVPISLEKPFDYNDVNINGTLNVLEAARQCNVKRVVFASSSSVYGDAENLPDKESNTPKPFSPYAITKLAGELYMQSYHKLYGMETINLRYFNVFGPFQDPNSQYSTLIPIFIKKTSNGESPIIFGDGTQSRDFTYVKDVAEANILACTAKNVAGETFNIACGRSIKINELTQKIGEILGKTIGPKYTKERLGDVKCSLADITKARERLGYEPKYDFENGLRETIKWFQIQRTFKI